MKHNAIIELYSNVVSVSGNGDNAVAIDIDGNVVNWDASAVATKEAELLAAFELDELRTERNRLLADTDYLALSDQTLTDAMSTYRQALRDITDTYSNLNDVVWPEKP